MELYRILSDLIDLRSFSNIWYWIGLAVVWSCSSHWVMGIPYDMISRARRQGGEVADDLQLLAAVNARRLLGLSRTAAVPLFFVTTFFFTSLGLLAFWFRIEFAEALFLLTIWFVPVTFLTLQLALRIEAGEDHGPALWNGLMWLRRKIQLLGMFAIFVTALFGMWRNLSHSALY